MRQCNQYIQAKKQKNQIKSHTMNAETRQQCWAMRDELYQCFNENAGNVAACQRSIDAMKQTCPEIWVRKSYIQFCFLKIYVMPLCMALMALLNGRKYII